MRMIAFLTLTTPMMLAGLACIGLPILAHLMNRTPLKRMMFPTLKLLTQSKASQSRLHRLRRLIVLLLRCAAVALICMAFTRPQWMSGDAQGGQSISATVLVVDRSASTAQQTTGISSLARMRIAASKQVDSLTPGRDIAAAVWAGARPEAAVPRLTANFDLLKQEIMKLSPGADRADLRQALAIAGRMLRDHKGPRRVILLSDFQRTNWTDNLAELAAQTLPPNTRIVLSQEGLSPPETSNTSLSAPRTLPARPVIGRPARALVQVNHFGAKARTVKLTARQDGRTLDVKTITLSPMQQMVGSFDLPPLTGPSELVFELETGDALELDDRAWLALDPVGKSTILLIADDDPAQPSSAAYYLSRAIAPAGEQEPGMVLRVIRSAAVDAQALAGARAVVVGQIDALSQRGADAIADYVDGGGGLLLFCGYGPVDQNVQSLDRALPPAGLSPFAPKKLIFLGDGEQALRISSGLWHLPALADFDPATQAALRSITFKRTWRHDPAAPGAESLLAFNDQSIALGYRQAGKGKVIFANFIPEPSFTTLPRHGLFVALVQSLLDDLASAAAADQALVGGPASLNIPLLAGTPAMGMQAVDPSGKPLDLEISLQGAEARLLIPRVDQPGFIRIRQDSRTLGLIAVNIDPRESDLRSHAPSEIAPPANPGEAAGGPNITIAPLDGQSDAELPANPLWHWMLMGALFMFALELLIVSVYRQ